MHGMSIALWLEHFEHCKAEIMISDMDQVPNVIFLLVLDVDILDDHLDGKKCSQIQE